MRAAIELADADGLAAVSMARVAERLGNSTMALYRHVKSKDELLRADVDAALGAPDRRCPKGVDWRDRADLLVGRDVLTAYARHRWYSQLPISGPPVGTEQPRLVRRRPGRSGGHRPERGRASSAS